LKRNGNVFRKGIQVNCQIHNKQRSESERVRTEHEKDIEALRRDSERIRADFEKWKRQRLHSIMTEEDCEKVQDKCRTSICGKIDRLSTEFHAYALNAHANAQRNAMFIGAVCDKLNIPVPEVK
jgi:hypothetical protein